MHLIWQGWDDLHAKVWFSRNKNALAIRILRRDSELAPGDETLLRFAFAEDDVGELTVPGDGKSPTATWKRGEVEKPIKIQHSGHKEIRLVTLTLPHEISGLSEAALQQSGIPLNAIASDDDGGGVETRIHSIRPRIGIVSLACG